MGQFEEEEGEAEDEVDDIVGVEDLFDLPFRLFCELQVLSDWGYIPAHCNFKRVWKNFLWQQCYISTHFSSQSFWENFLQRHGIDKKLLQWIRDAYHRDFSAIWIKTDAGDILDEFVVLRLVGHCEDHVQEQLLWKKADAGLLSNLVRERGRWDRVEKLI